jgi:hypothetical protein
METQAAANRLITQLILDHGVVLPSLLEGFGLPVAEAVAAGGDFISK